MAKYLSLMAILMFFCSCEVEFDPNAQWQPTTVVYGILDQDDDTTFVRVQKGFLGSGNYIEFAKEKDSVYYRQDEIDVFMVSYYHWEKDIIRDTFWFEYCETNAKPEGEFYSENAPLYYCVTKGRLSGEELLKMEYRLVVRNRQSGEAVQAVTRLIGDYDITAPGNIMYFTPKNGRNLMECSWYNLNSSAETAGLGIAAKMYQPVMRFYYRLEGRETFADIELATKISTRNDAGFEMKYILDMDDVVNGIKTQLKPHKGKVSWTNRLTAFEFYVNSCTMEMYDYYSNSLQSGNLLSDKPLYTNVEGGYGLFAARRRHIKQVFTTEDGKLLTAIKALEYGF